MTTTSSTKMVLRENKTITDYLFVLGLLLQVVAQTLFTLTNKFNLLEPIDFIHWTLLIGVVLIIPGTLSFVKGLTSKIGVVIAFMGIITQIGMCAIDFVLWSFKDNYEAKNALYDQLVSEPSIWQVFITVGPALTFVGFVIVSYAYFKSNLKGFTLLNLGAILVAIGGLIFTDMLLIKILGYILFSVGVLMLYFQKKEDKLNHNKAYNILFIIGLLFEMVGQILLAPGNDFVYALKPIDFAHWSLLLGAALMMPKIVNFPKKIITYIGAPTALIGAVCIIGMCILDFIWWNMTFQEMRNEFASHISQFPSIWKPFITTGTSFLNIGLLILSLNYIKQNKLAFILIILATLIIFGGRFIPHRLILVYLMTAIGFGIIFFYKKTVINEH